MGNFFYMAKTDSGLDRKKEMKHKKNIFITLLFEI